MAHDKDRWEQINAYDLESVRTILEVLWIAKESNKNMMIEKFTGLQWGKQHSMIDSHQIREKQLEEGFP